MASIRFFHRFRHKSSSAGIRRVLSLAALFCVLQIGGWAGEVDGERALAMIHEQCAFGPRVPGTDGHQRGAQWIRTRLHELKLTTVEQPFEGQLALINTSAPSINFYGLPAADGPTSPALLLTAHWDTRPLADRDPSGSQPAMLGANDGASGVALALEIARALQGTPQGRQVVLLFHDAEDAGVYGDNSSWCKGAQYAAAHPPAWIKRVRLGINLDLVAGADTQYTRDQASLRAAPEALAALWRLGGALGANYFSNAPAQQVVDDHVAWIDAGVPFINLLGLPWTHWHTAGDKPANCSAAALQATGDVVLTFIQSGEWHR
jgi:hypothetical protein